MSLNQDQELALLVIASAGRPNSNMMRTRVEDLEHAVGVADARRQTLAELVAELRDAPGRDPLPLEALPW